MAKLQMSSVDVSPTEHACFPNNSRADMVTENKIEEWTKEDVRHWLINVIKVPQQYADILYNKDVYGASLICFDKQDFLDAGLEHGPAVHILKKTSQLKTSSDINSAIPDTYAFEETSKIEHYQQDSEASERPSGGFSTCETTPHCSVPENWYSTVQRWSPASEDTVKFSGFQESLEFEEQDDLKCQTGGGASSTQSTQLQLPHSTKPNNVESVTKENSSKSSVIRLCKPRPFDKSCTTFEYTQNEILPPETGPSNLIDPVHEYKLLANTENASEEDVLKKFTNEVFRFAAGCMNSRTNGTIHFGVGDEPQYKHGQITGIKVTSPNKYIDAFYKCLKEHFTNHISIVTGCIRPPQFFKVKCPDNINDDKWIIEVDVVPMYELTVEKRFYTALDKKGKKSKCLFIRDGANTRDYFSNKNPKRKRQNEKDLKDDLKLWALSRKLAED